jgi:hypothetical protein
MHFVFRILSLFAAIMPAFLKAAEGFAPVAAKEAAAVSTH